jgi:peptidyl-prolyl cis-trans isomerase-like protein 2
MGKKSMSKDRGYITASEWAIEGGGYKNKMEGVPFRRLPFNCCAVSFLPFDDPVCTADGTVMDIMHAVPYVQTHGKHPVTGEPLQLKDLTKLTFHKNSEGDYECPVLNKVFTDSTHIVAVKTTGNVYCYQAIDELCVKPKNWKDLITDEKFTRKDLVTLQDPLNLEGRMLDKFEHVKKGHEIDRGGGGNGTDDNLNSRAMSADIKRVLEKLGTEDATAALVSGGGGRRAEAERILAEAKHKADATAEDDAGPDKGADKSRLLKAPTNHPLDNVTFKPGSHTWNTDGPSDWRVTHAKAADSEEMKKRDAAMRERFKAVGSHIAYKTNAMRTTGAGSTSFTSTVMGNATVNERVEEVVKRNPPKGKKGYVQLCTNLGDINVELHCDVAPRTCENFIVLCKAGYYDGVGFHRSIKNFMIQGGDPTGTGSGGQCIWGDKFKDEITHLNHDGRGVLSMANSGPGTNGSQFFITYKSANYLDGKHTVFGRLVGGADVLSEMERVPTADDDRPSKPITIESTKVFTDPYKDMAEAETVKAREKKEKEEKEARERTEALNPGRWWSDPAGQMAKEAGDDGALKKSGGIGKYVSKPASGGDSNAEPAKKKAKTGGFGNFDGW